MRKGAGILLAQGSAPHAGAGTYFHERVKVGKGLLGESIDSLPQNPSQRPKALPLESE
ncbi:hypothetical protein [Clostridium merdae]|uniref:hypothetical protein n=1 Tax=Clostridium merdae TaxID=1958780 RepID=UPI00135653BA|nr:hypothetical protein [Clostridium merdae]